MNPIKLLREDRDGTVLVQVLIMSLLMVYLAALLLRAVMSQWTLAGQSAGNVSSHKRGEGILGMVNARWSPALKNYCQNSLSNSNGVTNCSPVGSGCDCASAASSCSCTCDAVIGGTTYSGAVVVTATGSSCQIQAKNLSY